MRPETIAFPDGLPVRAFVRCVEQYPYHWHDTLEIIQVLKGTVNINMGNDNLLLHENDLAVINMGELHRIAKSRDNEILFVHIDAGFCRSVLPDNRYLFIYCCTLYHAKEAPEKYEALREHIAGLLRALYENNSGEYQKNIENILTSLLNYLTYNFDFLRWGHGVTAFDEKLVERLLYIADRTSSDYQMNPGLKELATEIEISPYHLSHDIKNKFGETFLQLLYYSKCEHAAKLLLSTGKRIIEIALECGFSDAKYLIKHFKQNFQHAPSKFRKMYQADAKTLASQAQYRDIPLASAVKFNR